MGTNYYVKFEVTEKMKSTIINMVELYLDDNDLEGLRDYFEFDVVPNRVHIGKSSGGWQFLFNTNNKEYYDLNRKSIDKFIRREDVTFIDEYGDKVDPDEFWEKVDIKDNNWDSETYYKDHPEHKSPWDNTKHDFHENGLRFSTSTQFS